ncbi:GATA transcription factor 5-like isoform X2 [Humulus lupulus]|uniref:GATA transcription factor 5-like isoform X2 n=1 Tax=Humulus lupulus TaxID=3486 RepID=UPI002B404FA7|nr:GATA transcription factor 5-like isoform X2 [Humulus lupulus]
MDICRNVSLGGEYEKEEHNLSLSPPSSDHYSSSSGLDQLFSSQTAEEDLSLEWLSVFVEDCLTSSGNCLPLPPLPNTTSSSTTTNITSTCTNVLQTPKPSKPLEFHKDQKKPTSLETFSVPSKARSKRKRAVLTKRRDPLTIWSSQQKAKKTTTTTTSYYEYPPLLQQAYWLADSELIVPTKEVGKEKEKENGDLVKEQPLGLVAHGLVARRCSHCLSQKTPQWRAGPLGPKTLCNACGVRYKSGRLLPEYRPAKSPTFVSYLHSNSHKKVMEMRNGS